MGRQKINQKIKDEIESLREELIQEFESKEQDFSDQKLQELSRKLDQKIVKLLREENNL